MRVQLDFRHLAFFDVHRQDDVGIQRLRKIFADSVHLLFGVLPLTPRWVGCDGKVTETLISLIAPVDLLKIICARTAAGGLKKEGYPSLRDIWPRVRRAISIESLDNAAAIC